MMLSLLLSSFVWASLWAKNSDEPKLPPPLVKPKPVAKLPRTFPVTKDVELSAPVQFEPLSMAPLRSMIYVTNLVMSNPPESLGEVVVTDTNTNTVGPFQYVLIRSSRAAVGESYVVVKELGTLKFNPDEVEVEGTPHSVQIQGEVKIVGSVQVPKLKETLWRAQVTKSYNPLEIGGKLSDVKIPSVDLTQRGVPALVEGEVIGGGMNLNRRLLEPGATVFLSRGVEDGIRVGQLIEVYSTQSLYAVRAALIRVAHVDPNFSTAVIVTADREVQPGDRLSRPE